jgi:hypothetical protein
MAEPRWKHLGFSSQQSFAGKCGAIKRKIAKINPRRHDLIHKQCLGSGLTQDESEELEQLQKQVGDLVRVIAPLPNFEDLEKQLTDRRKELETEKGIKAIIFLQGTANIEEPEERARANWLAMSDAEKQTTMETYEMLKE